MFGMRGVDYRATQFGLNLLIAAPFENSREAMQGLCRVGRFGDRCERYILKGVELIDEERNNMYLKKLFKFTGDNQLQNCCLKPIPELNVKSKDKNQAIP